MLSNHYDMEAQTVIARFKSALATYQEDLAQTMWNDIPLLQMWCSGRKINFSSEAGIKDMRSISLKELISIFKLALLSRYKNLIDILWVNNPLLQAWYFGMEITLNNNHDLQANTRVITPTELINCFKLTLFSDCQVIALAMWKKNPLLRAWYMGQVISFGNDESGTPIQRSMLPEELIASFNTALSTKGNFIVDIMWKNSSLIQTWYSSKEVSFANNKSGQPIYRTIPPHELISGFNSALANHYRNIVKAIWEKNHLLRNLYTGCRANFDFNELEKPVMLIIPTNEFMNTFNLLLMYRYLSIIKIIWEENALVRAYYSGRNVSFSNDKFGQPTNENIPLDGLIANFENALTCHYPRIINDMWRNNPSLQNAIKAISIEEFQALFQKVISCCAENNKEFVFQYLTIIENIDIVRNALDHIKKTENKKLSKEKLIQISVLETCLTMMMDNRQHNKDIIGLSTSKKQNRREDPEKEQPQKNNQPQIKKPKLNPTADTDEPDCQINSSPTLFAHHFNLPATPEVIPQQSQSTDSVADIDDYVISGWSPKSF